MGIVTLALHKGVECTTQIASYLQHNEQLRSANGREISVKMIVYSPRRISILIELMN